MIAKEIMTPGPQVCRADTSIPEVAKMMCGMDCGAIPVVDEQDRPIGIVTDRDIACRIVAEDKDTLQAQARDCMTRDPITVGLDASDEECYELLERQQIRRLIVVDARGICAGVISQADVARKAPKRKTGEIVQEVSQEKRPPARTRRPTVNP
jgi:CBS domain-containing protein